MEVTPASWPDLERLFGDKGACAGCWCQFWRIGKDERFNDIKGATAKRRFKKQIESGAAHGILAYAGDEPVGWCAFERRVDLPKLDSAPSLRVDDAEQVWSLPCFFVKTGWRGKGVATAMLAAAQKALRKRRARVAEGYPLKVTGKTAAAFVWTGVPALFEKAGFHNVAPKAKGKQRVRKAL